MGTVWELDFYSRPIVDEQQKKIWEVLVCDPQRTFEYTKFCPSNRVNATWLRTALEEAVTQAPVPPEKIRFFRRQMNNMITLACEGAGIPVQPSRRTFALYQWLQQRTQEVYPTYPGFKPVASASVSYEEQPPQPLPDALMGQQWAFVSLEASAFEDMQEWAINFGETFPLQMIGLAPETLIPGMVIFSPRAIPLAGWMSGLEMAFLKVDSGPSAKLLLETGASDRWILAPLRNAATQAEAQAFEQAKDQAQQVHFLAVQSDPQAESFAGFWLLQEVNLA